MIALAAQWSEGGGQRLLGWVVPASVVLHVVGVAVLPSARRLATPPAPPPVVIEVAPDPPRVDPPKEPPPPEPAAAPTVASPRATAPTARAPANAPATTATTTNATAPVDFTSMVFSNDGPGLAVGGPAGGAPGPAPTAAPAAKAAPVEPRLVPAASLARRPRAPGLDAELERQYPSEARRTGISGVATLRVRILPDGRIGTVQVVSESWTGFGPACERTVRRAKWEPPIDHDGAPVATEITYTCRFEVRS